MQKLKALAVEKPWGRVDLPDMFGNPDGRRIGEIWYQADAREDLPLLVKYIFTSERLSIQVHPDDDQARAAGLPHGKEEAWYILDAEPGACVGIGLTRPLSPEAFRAAALDGSLERLIDWKPVTRGQCYFIPAGTVHAIGAGITLVEVQQNVDVTYRLYDYGRPRERHLEAGVAASRLEPYRRPAVEAQPGEARRLVSDAEAPFRLDLRRLETGEEDGLPPEERLWFIPLCGRGMIGGQPWAKGDCWLIDGDDRLTVEEDGAALLAAARRGAGASPTY